MTAIIQTIDLNARCVTLLSLQNALMARMIESGGGTLNVSDLRAVFKAEIDKLEARYID